MSKKIADEIIEKSIFGVPVKKSSEQFAPTPVVSSVSSNKTSQHPVSRPNLMSPVPKEVRVNDGISTFTLPDGREFRLDQRGNPVVDQVQGRKIPQKVKEAKRAEVDPKGRTSFEDTGIEVDHKVSVGLGGTYATSNLEGLKNKKTISQEVFNFLSGGRLPVSYKEKNRQEGKVIVERKAIDKYRAGEITLFEAMAAVDNFDNKELVADFLDEPFTKSELNYEPTSTPITKVFNFIKTKVKEKVRKEALKDVFQILQNPRFKDTEDGVEMIRQVSESVDQYQLDRTVDQEALSGALKFFQIVAGGRLGLPSSGITPREVAGVVSAPVRYLPAELARLSVGLRLEVAGSDLRYTPSTDLQKFLMGERDFQRIAGSDDLYGMTQKVIQEKMEEAGVERDQAYVNSLAGVVLLGGFIENPFFAFGKKVAKEAGEVALRQLLSRELGRELVEEEMELVSKEVLRMSNLKTEDERMQVVADFTKMMKERPQVEVGQKYSQVLNPPNEPVQVFNGSNRGVIEDVIKPNKPFVIEGDQRTFIKELAEKGDEQALSFLETEPKTWPEFDRFLSERYKGDNDFVVINRREGSQAWTEFLETKSGKFSTDNRDLAELYSLQDRSGKYEKGLVPNDVPTKELGVKEFNALPFEEQERVFSNLSPEVKKEIVLGEEQVESSLDKVGLLLDDIFSGRQKINVSKYSREDIQSTIGRGRYMQFFRKNANLQSIDDLSTSVGLTDNELLEAIAKESKLLTEGKSILPSASSGKKTKTPKVEKSPEVATSGLTRLREIQSKAPVKIGQKVSSFEEILAQTPTDVKDKVNLLDYLRTPDRVLEKIGLADETKLLRTGYEAYVKELPSNIEKITGWVKRVPKSSNEKLFQHLDGKDVQLSDSEKVVANEIRTWLAEWADRLGLPKDNRIASYITHIFDEELIAKEFDEDLAKIISDKIPGEVYDPFLLKRLGKRGYKQDTWAALDAYVKRGTRKVHIDPALEAFKAKAGSSLETTQLEQSQFKYLKRFISNVNLRPTELDNLIDTSIKSVFGYKGGQRPVTRLTRLLRQMTYRGMLGLNPASALKNISQGINTYAVLGEKYTSVGYLGLFKSGATDELREVGVLKNDFIQDRVLSSSKKAVEKLDKGLFYFFETAEKINRGAAYFGAKSKALSEGKTVEEAVEYAREIVRKTQFAFGSIDTPVALQSDIVKTFLQFQTFSLKQVEFLTELVKDKNFAGLLRYGVAGVVFVNTIGQIFGMETKDLMPGFRLGTPPSLKLPVETTKALLNTPDKFGNERDLEEKTSDVLKSGIGLVPAGIQLKKSIEGAKSVSEGGSFDRAGNLQFEQGGSNFEKLRTLIFGKYAQPSAEKYFEKEEVAEKASKKMEPTFEKVQELNSSGSVGEAQAIVDSLTDEEYETYKKIRSSKTREETLNLQKEVLKVYQRVQKLVSEGSKEEAQAIVDELSDEEYEMYEQIKKKLN